jgi:hypothetical protein
MLVEITSYPAVPALPPLADCGLIFDVGAFYVLVCILTILGASAAGSMNNNTIFKCHQYLCMQIRNKSIEESMYIVSSIKNNAMFTRGSELRAFA